MISLAVKLILRLQEAFASAKGVVFIASFGLLFSLILWRHEVNHHNSILTQNFEQSARTQYLLIEREFQHMGSDLEEIVRFFNNSEFVTKQEFNNLVDAYLNEIPELVSIDWAPLVLSEHRHNFEALIQGHIMEADLAGKLVNRNETAEFFPVLYSSRRQNQISMLGFDYYSCRDCNVAMADAVRLASLQSIFQKELIRLPRVIDRTGYILFFAPVFKDQKVAATKSVLGFIVGVYSASRLIELVQNRLPASKLEVSIKPSADYNGDEHVASDDIYSNRMFVVPQNLSFNRELTVAGKVWLISFKPTNEFVAQANETFPIMILVFPLFLTAATSAYLYSLFKKNQLLLETEKLLVAKSLEVQAASDAKGQFLVEMSHEIRTPLTGIIGFSEMLAKHNLGADEMKSAIESNYANAKYLLSLVNYVLDKAKLESGSVDLEITCENLFVLTADIHGILKRKAADKKLDFEFMYNYPLPRIFSTDFPKLKQILINLTDNAIKFTSSGSVKIQVSFIQEAERLEFSIEDTGFGIAPEQICRLFQTFSQADCKIARDFGGSGLGLALSKKLAQRLGGDIVVKSEPNKGSVFILNVATGKVSNDDLIYNETQIYPANKSYQAVFTDLPRFNGNILVAEDGIENQKFLVMLFSKMGLTVTVVSDGSEAIEAVKSAEFSLIVMDLQMSILGGIEATRILRQLGIKTPILALSADNRQEEIGKFFDAGCDDFLSKPFDRDQLITKLTSFLKPLVQTAAVQQDDSSEQEYSGIAQHFVESFDLRLDELEQALQTNDYDFLAASTHKLAGAAAFAYPAVFDALVELDDASRKHDDIRLECALLRLRKIHCGGLMA